MSTIRIPDQLRFWEPEADRLLMEFVRQALDEGGTVMDGCQRFAQALQATGPRVAPTPEQMAMRWEVLQAFGGLDPARDPQAVAPRDLAGASGGTAPLAGGTGSYAAALLQVAQDLRRLGEELHRTARRLEALARSGPGQAPGPGGATQNGGGEAPAGHPANR
ncbi:MAG TPA: hypothetical protein VIK92_09310 [Thermaerobacter sp.]